MTQPLGTPSPNSPTWAGASSIADGDLRAGVDNLLLACAGMRIGQSVLVVNEISASADAAVADVVETRARELGAQVSSVHLPRVSSAASIPADLAAAIDQADAVVFNHTLGFMLRFQQRDDSRALVVNQALTREVLASRFARSSYPLWREIVTALESAFAGRRRWRMTCPLGTDISGPMPEWTGIPGRSAIRAFPVGIHRLISAGAANGRLVLRWITVGSVRDFGVEGLIFETPVTATVADGRIVDLQGASAEVSRLRALLSHVGDETGEDPYRINAWHVGTHPEAECPFRDRDGLNRWMDLAHNNPRMAHFHMVGERNGVCSLPLIDTTVIIDDTVFWRRGRFEFLDSPIVGDLLAKHGLDKHAFVPRPALGIDEWRE